MLNSVVHAVTMEICVAMWFSSVEEMVVNSIRMSIQHVNIRYAFNAFHVLGPMKF